MWKRRQTTSVFNLHLYTGHAGSFPAGTGAAFTFAFTGSFFFIAYMMARWPLLGSFRSVLPEYNSRRETGHGAKRRNGRRTHNFKIYINRTKVQFHSTTATGCRTHSTVRIHSLKDTHDEVMRRQLKTGNIRRILLPLAPRILFRARTLIHTHSHTNIYTLRTGFHSHSRGSLHELFRAVGRHLH